MQPARPPFPLLTRFQGFVRSGGERGVRVPLFAVFVGSVRKLRVNKPAPLLLLRLRLHLHKGAAAREGARRGAPGGGATLFVWELKDTDESPHHSGRGKEREDESSLVPVDCVLPVDVRSGSLTSLETPAVIISTPSRSPLASGSISL